MKCMNQKKLREILRWIGYRGRFAPFFAMEEIGAILVEDAAWDREAALLEAEWQKSQPAKEEREKAFPLTSEQVFEARSAYLLEQYRQAVKEFEDARIEGEIYAAKLPTGATKAFVVIGNRERLEKLAKRKARAKLNYECWHASRKGISAEEIARARETPISKISASAAKTILCPFHKEKTPSCSITRNLFYCHGCGEGGDVITFVMRTKNFGFCEAIRWLGKL